ncbi:MAG: DUF2177 family protein [Bdellovibrionales bacterium]|nr:DUF2177 family protein [Bdellovibrionales bacterium]
MKYSFINLFIFLVIDGIWLKFIVGGFFTRQLAPIALLNEEGAMRPRLLPALVVYVLMALALEVFVLRQFQGYNERELIFKAAFLGLVVYGIFDFTNRAILAHYPWPMVILDVTWGTFVFGLTAYLSLQTRRWLSL